MMAVKNHRDMVNVEATMDKIARWEQLIPDFHMDWVNEASLAQEFDVELYREAMVEDEGDGFSLPSEKLVSEFHVDVLGAAKNVVYVDWADTGNGLVPERFRFAHKNATSVWKARAVVLYVLTQDIFNNNW